MTFRREQTQRIHLGNVPIGGGAPIAIQSMTKTNTSDTVATLAQIERLAHVGCEIIRCAIPDMKAALALKTITQSSPLPVVADIHFNASLAIAALEHGAAALRINPGTINNKKAIDKIIDAAKSSGVPIRVGSNSGSIPKELLLTYNGPTPEAIVQATLNHIHLLESRNFYNIKVSLKSSNTKDTIAASRLFAKISNYPQHIGITEAGGFLAGSIKNAIGIGSLLLDGIGDTLRVSLTTDPVHEVEAAWHILHACGLRRRGIEIISCPSCGRSKINLINLLKTAERELALFQIPLTVAIMGCIVNGPGEASHADIGIAGGKGYGVVFVHGKIIRKVAESDLIAVLIQEILRVQNEY